MSGKYGVCESSQGGTKDGAEMVKEGSERTVGLVAKLLTLSELQSIPRSIFERGIWRK